MPDDLRPMCLRTHRFLLPEEEIEPGVWRCHGRLDCPGGHDYRLAGGDDEARAIVDRALSYARTRFEAELSQPIVVWHSPGADELPESTTGSAGEHAIYLSHSTPEQGAYQASHEVFHTLFTPVDTHHWTHEMLAVVFSLDFLAAEGFADYRVSTIDGLDRASAALRLDDLVAVVGIPYPRGTYGRASVIGRQLVGLVGSDRFFELRDSWVAGTGSPEYDGWVEALPGEIRSRVASVGQTGWRLPKAARARTRAEISGRTNVPGPSDPQLVANAQRIYVLMRSDEVDWYCLPTTT